MEEIIKYWQEYLGPEFWEVVERRWELEKKINRLKNEFKKREEEIRNRISELKYKGRVRRKLTEEEKKNYVDSVWNYWEKTGGDPFDEPVEAPDYVWGF